ncbi:unnamed protein product [Chrysoparadoxa australica]
MAWFLWSLSESLYTGSPWPYFSQNFFVFRLLRDFFKLKFEVHPKLKEHAESTKKTHPQYFFGLHPHGAIGDYRILFDGMLLLLLPPITFTSLELPFLPSWRALAASILFRLPFIREIALWTSCIDASRGSTEQALRDGHSIFVVCGGEKEQLLCQKGVEEVYITKRKGFVRLALKHGTPLVPCYVFGCTDAYTTSRFLYSLREMLVNKLSVCLPIFWGPYGLPAVPHRVPQVMCFGEPIVLEKCEKPDEPSKQEIAAAHDKYIQAMRTLFDANKERLGYGDRELIIS